MKTQKFKPNHKTYDVDELSQVIGEIISDRLNSMGKHVEGITSSYVKDVTKEITTEINLCLKYDSIN